MNNTLKNGFTVFEYLAGEAEECSVKELAEHFDLPNSHICRLLKTLVDTGYVEQTPGSRKYRVSMKILNLSHARLSKLALRNVARPYMRKLAAELPGPVYLSANHHGYSLIIGTEYPDYFHGDAELVVGRLHSVNHSACGKICAAFAGPEELEVLLGEGEWKGNPTEARKRFKTELELIRSRGYSQMLGEAGPGVGAVGAPLFNASGVFVGGLGAILPGDEKGWTPELLERFTNSVMTAAGSISFALGLPSST